MTEYAMRLFLFTSYVSGDMLEKWRLLIHLTLWGRTYSPAFFSHEKTSSTLTAKAGLGWVSWSAVDVMKTLTFEQEPRLFLLHRVLQIMYRVLPIATVTFLQVCTHLIVSRDSRPEPCSFYTLSCVRHRLAWWRRRVMYWQQLPDGLQCGRHSGGTLEQGDGP